MCLSISAAVKPAFKTLCPLDGQQAASESLPACPSRQQSPQVDDEQLPMQAGSGNGHGIGRWHCQRIFSACYFSGHKDKKTRLQPPAWPEVWLPGPCRETS
jgi:hypothetical protein